MKSLKLLFLAGVAMMFASCDMFGDQTEDPNKPTPDQGTKETPVVVTVSLGDMDTKAGYEGELAEGSLGLFYVTEDASSRYNALNREVRYNSGKWDVTGDSLFHKGGATAAYYAYFPYDSKMDASAEYSLRVSDEQTAKNIKSSDFLASSPSSTGTEKVQIYFEHQLAKLKVRLTASDELGTDYSFRSVVIKGCALKGSYNLAQQSWSKVDTELTDITMLDNENSTFEAILIPQTASWSLNVKVKINGENQTFSFGPEESFKFESGCQYTLPLTIGHDSVIPGKISIDSWDEIKKDDLVTEK